MTLLSVMLNLFQHPPLSVMLNLFQHLDPEPPQMRGRDDKIGICHPEFISGSNSIMIIYSTKFSAPDLVLSAS